MPELEKANYSRKYSLGCITAAGALSTLIPPSMGILMFCLVAPDNLSVGTALVGGIGPGILTAVALGVTVRIIGVIWPGSIPKGQGEKIPFIKKLASFKLLGPILVLFALIIGGSFMGWFPATVGGAIGAVACCVYAVAKRIPAKRLAHCLWEAAVMNAGIFPIIIAGQIFGRFVSATGIAATLANAIASVNAPPFIVFMLVIVLYVFCGAVMDIMSIIIITVPIVFPVLTGLGYSPYVLVIALCFMTEIAGLTPPIGMNVFATSNALRVSPMEVFSGVVPYVICELVMVILIAVFPIIVTFIPNLL
jgi:C4-dicarboxylate transporter, DctM subunit